MPASFAMFLISNIFMLFICSDIWETSAIYLCLNIKEMTKKFVNEERFCKIFENIFNEKFPNVRPSWLINHQTGFLLELDSVCDTLNLAFEFDGIQHNEYPNPFHKT